MGDFNLSIDPSSSDAGQLSDILESFDAHLYVDFPTHMHIHSLDLMICSTGFNALSVSTSDLISDHFLLLLTCEFYPSIVGLSHKLSSTESYNRSTLKPPRLISHILHWLDIPKLMQLDWLNNMTVSSTLINLHVPLVTKKISPKPSDPWISWLLAGAGIAE